MISDKKKLEMIQKVIKNGLHKDDIAFLYKNKFDNTMDWNVAAGFLAALRQLGPVIECAKLAKSGVFDLLYMQYFGEVSLRQAGLEE